MTSPTQPAWIADAIFYQVFVDRFANGRPKINPEGAVGWDSAPTRANFFGGDLRGITEHLDHIEQLGANALYLTPIFEADTNHRYDTADYSRIDHRLGDMNDYQALRAETDRRGIRLVLDAVFNHTGEGHWAFRHVRAHGEQSAYRDWYRMEFPVIRDPKPNYGAFANCPYLPQLNHANPAVRSYLYDIALDWLRTGIDGWRLDVPFEIDPDFWRGFRQLIKTENREAYIVGEVWELATEWLGGDLFDGTMNYPLRSAILDFASGRANAVTFEATMAQIRAATPAWARPGMLNLLGSHDTARLWTQLGGDRFAWRVATVLQFTGEGAPMIYYGDEIGLSGGEDPDNRRPMPWDSAKWDHDLLAWTRALAQLRTSHKALSGPDDDLQAVGPDVIVRRRGRGQAEVSLLINVGHRPAALELQGIPSHFAPLLGDAAAFQVRDGIPTLSGRSVVILGGT